MQKQPLRRNITPAKGNEDNNVRCLRNMCRLLYVQHEVDGVRGAGAGGAEEGVEVEGECVIAWQSVCLGGFCRVEPFLGEDGGEEAGGAGDGGGEAAGAEGGTVDEEVELVGGGAAIGARVEGDGDDTVGDGGRGDFHALHRAATDDDAWEVDLAVWGEAVLVELTEDGVGAVVFAHGLPVESDEVGLLHVGRELRYHREVAAVSLLRLGLRIGHGGGHGALALPPVPGVVYLVAEFAALAIAVFSRHKCSVCKVITLELRFYCAAAILQAGCSQGAGIL